MRDKNLGRRNKSEKRQNVLFNEFVFFVLCFSFVWVFAFGGCRSEEVSQMQVISTEETEAELLAQLDKRFENPEVHFRLGQLYQTQERWAKAKYHYNVALSFDPAHRPTQAAMVKMLTRSGEAARAGDVAANYMNQVSSSVKESLCLGRAFDQQGLDKYALACFQQALRSAPNSPEANREVGYYYLTRNDKSRAEEYLSRSFQLNPNQPDVAGELGRLGVVVEVRRGSEIDTTSSNRSPGS